MSLPTSGNLPGFALLAALSAAALGGGGCATGGPNHVYFTSHGSPAVHDLGPPPAQVDRAVAPDELVEGLAYDFNTDHLFLRIAPAQVIRVIERPSGKILREMPLPVGLQTTRPADLAIRPGDRHLFAVHPDGRSIVELTLFGDFVRRIELRGPAEPVSGLTYDQKNHRLLVLTATSPARVGTVAPDGFVIYYMTIESAVDPVSLGYDSAAGHVYVPLADGKNLGEFDAEGKLLATIPSGPVTAVDAGPRSFVRIF
ncbi:MAG: hypothetical protein PSU94_07830 [Lacunisphaera sp.]|nr:hypothetical protein [Lacunisphaera sp.]